MGPGPTGEVLLVGGESKGSYLIFTHVSEKTTENSEQLDRQMRLWIESGTSHLPALRAEPLGTNGATNTWSINIHIVKE